ncbi:MAG: PTS sugar transporter subunit IIA [Myxococcales bacterium]|nr:PTS sugar transporter subunit IIA [Myxococcales bacterium]
MEFSSVALMSMAIVLLAGIVGAELLARLKLPKVTGWIITGIALRAASIPGLRPEELNRFIPFTDFVLGYIAFTVGTAFHLASLRNAGKRLGLLMLTEATLTTLVVVLALTWIGGQSLAVSLILGAVAVAGAPGTTMIVVREARAKGLFVKTLIAGVALIDVIAVIFFAMGLSLVKQEGSGMTLHNIGHALGSAARQLGLALLVGGAAAAGALALARRVVSPAFVGPLAVVVIMGAWGTGKLTGVSSILACTFAGMALTNLRHDTTRAVEAYLHPIGNLLFAGFYTFAGMRLNFGLVLPMVGLVLLFFAARLVGKVASSATAMTIAQMPAMVRRYLGVALLPHGGVAVGLILLVEETESLAYMHDVVATVGLAALAINQLLGPSATRFALDRTGETSLDRPRLLDFLSEQHILVGLRAKSKAEAIETLTKQLYATADQSIAQADFLDEALRREEEEATCLGEGFMVPHVSLPDGEEITGVLGISNEGLDFDAPDGKKVHAVLLLATPEADRKRHLEILAAFARAITRDPALREQLYHARNAAHAYQILHAEDGAEHFNYFLDETMARSMSR